jgi:hypothetical protein
MSVDIVGVQPIANLIKQTGLTKFIIYRNGARTNSVPIFECLASTQNKRTQDLFCEWANNMLLSNPANAQEYELYLFSDIKQASDQVPVEDPEEEEEGTRNKKSAGNKIRVNFCLSNPQSVGFGGSDYIRKEDLAQMMKDTLERNELLRSNKELSDRLSALEDPEEEEEEEEEGKNILAQAEGFLDKIMSFNNKIETKVTPASAVAEVGAITDTNASIDKAQVKANIQKAITILFKHNNQLDKDLLKLSQIAEENPTLFNMYMQGLRKM